MIVDQESIEGWKLENLSRDTLIKLVRMLYLNYMAVDGRWFQAVEDEWGIDVATRLDEKVWKKHSAIEGRRVKEALDITGEGLPAVFKALNFTIWRFFEFAPMEWEEISPQKVVVSFKACPVQEIRLKKNREEFPCKKIGLYMLENTAAAIDHRVQVKCLLCPPDPHPEDVWCKWEFSCEAGHS